MHANDEHFFIVGTIEDANAPALWQMACGAPEKIMLQLLRARLFETEYLTTLWIHARHDIPDRAILARRIHRLENQE